MPPELIVRVIGDTSQLEKSYKRAQQATGKFGHELEGGARGAIAASLSFRGLGRAIGFASAGFIGTAGLVEAAKAGFDELSNMQRVAAQTGAVLKSTGGIAGVSAKQVTDLATSLQQKTSADDEAIHSAENLLLTFTQVRNEAGKGNDIFTRTTKATLDLSQALGQDLQSSALQLGKALNDPVRGVTALRRVGIQFSASQQKVIKRLVDTGNILEAQKTILAEVNRQVGGSARAFGQTLPGQIKLLEGNLRNLAGDLATVLAPALDDVVKKFNAWLSNPENKRKIIEGFSTAVTDTGNSFKYLAERIKDARDKLNDFNNARANVQKHLGPFRFILDGPIQAFKDARDRVADLNRELGLTPSLLDDVRVAVGAFPHDVGTGTGALGATRSPLLPKQNVKVPGVFADPFADARPAPGDRGTFTSDQAAARARRARLLQQRNTFFDNRIARALDRVQDIPTLKGQIAKLREISGLVQQRINATKDITRKLKLEDQVAEIARTIRGDQADIAAKDADAAAKAAQAAKDAAAKAKEAAKKIAEANKTRLAALDAQLKAGQAYTAHFQVLLAQRAKQNADARRAAIDKTVFGLIGLTATGETRAPSRGNLEAQLRKAQDAIAGGPLDTKAMRSRLSQLRGVLNSEFSKLTRDTKIKVQEFLDALAGDKGQGPLTPRHAVTPLRDIVAGTGLRGAALRQLELNVASAGLATPSGRNRPIHVHATVISQLDGREVARNTIEHAERDSRRRAHQTRGRQTTNRSL